MSQYYFFKMLKNIKSVKNVLNPLGLAAMPDLRLGQTTLTDPREIDLGPCQTQEP